MKQREKDFDFVGKRKICFIISSALLVLTILLSFFPGPILDIQFKGGSIVTYSYEGDLSKDDVKGVVEKAIQETVKVQDSEDVRTGKKNIVISLTADKSLSAEKQIQLTEALTGTYKDNKIEQVSISNVDPVMGQEFLIKCILAVAVASLLMIVYMAFRFRKIGGWSAGAMAVVALLHDCMVVYLTFLICRFPINENFIAVLLVIVGYSINNTIVIYDRVRENRGIYGSKLKLAELVNKSTNQTIMRSINTTLTTVMALVVICVVALVCGVTSIMTFAFPMIIGMVSGFYTSLLLAGPLWVTWKDYRLKKGKPAKSKK